MPRFGETCKGHTIPYGTLSAVTGELRKAYYTYGYKNDEDMPPLPVVAPDPIQDYDPDEEPHEMMGWMLGAVSKLTRREQLIIAMRFLHDMTLEECGVHMDVTRERIRQIEARALRRIKKLAMDMECFDERQRKLRAKEYEDKQWFEQVMGKVTITVDGRVI